MRPIKPKNRASYYPFFHHKRMNSPMDQASESEKFNWQQSVIRVYATGLIVMAIIFLMWRVIHEFSPLYESVENPILAIALTLIGLILLPFLLGGLIQFGLNPILGKSNALSQLVGIQDRVFKELSKRRELPVVIVRTSATERQIGVMTSRIAESDSRPEMAVVYVPSAPRTGNGQIRLVPMREVEETDWALKDFQLFQWSMGSFSPNPMSLED